MSIITVGIDLAKNVFAESKGGSPKGRGDLVFAIQSDPFAAFYPGTFDSVSVGELAGFHKIAHPAEPFVGYL